MDVSADHVLQCFLVGYRDEALTWDAIYNYIHKNIFKMDPWMVHWAQTKQFR